MQIVIDIPEEVYERFGHEYSDNNMISKYTNDIILDAFCNGIPLPKGHGDKLILIGETHDNQSRRFYRHYKRNVGGSTK